MSSDNYFIINIKFVDAKIKNNIQSILAAYTSDYDTYFDDDNVHVVMPNNHRTQYTYKMPVEPPILRYSFRPVKKYIYPEFTSEFLNIYDGNSNVVYNSISHNISDYVNRYHDGSIEITVPPFKNIILHVYSSYDQFSKKFVCVSIRAYYVREQRKTSEIILNISSHLARIKVPID